MKERLFPVNCLFPLSTSHPCHSKQVGKGVDSTPHVLREKLSPGRCL